MTRQLRLSENVWKVLSAVLRAGALGEGNARTADELRRAGGEFSPGSFGALVRKGLAGKKPAERGITRYWITEKGLHAMCRRAEKTILGRLAEQPHQVVRFKEGS